MNEIEICSPATFERAARSLHGPLANAISGAKGKVASALFMGDKDVVSSASRWMATVAWLNKIPVFTWPAKMLAYRQGLYGNLLTTMLFAHKHPGDKLFLRNDQGKLSSVILKRESGEDIEFALKSGNGKVRILQILHFGKKLADGCNRLSLEFTYDDSTGILRSAGFTSIDEQKFFEQKSFSLGSRKIDEAMLLAYEKLLGYATDSLTFPVNCGVIAYALKFLQKPELAIDFNRVAVYALAFSRSANIAVRPGEVITALVEPISLKQTDKGQLLSAELVMSSAQAKICRTQITIMVRGNFPKKPDYWPKHIVFENLPQQAGGMADIVFMEDKQLTEFAAINGDHNPLHQIDSVARVVGFRKKINPGLGIAAQIETTLRNSLGKHLKHLSATLIRPVYPGQCCSLQFNANGHYQLVKKDKNCKVLVDGNFETF